MHPLQITRRHFFQDCGVGVGKMALASLMTQGAMSASARADGETAALVPQASHFAPKAKAVIHMFMAGAPSQLDLFDYKPKLVEYAGRSIPPEVIGGQRYAFIRSDAAALGPVFKFAKHGRCGTELSEALPELAKIVDDI